MLLPAWSATIWHVPAASTVTLPAAVAVHTAGVPLENATANIRVNAVAPGFTRTKLIEQGIRDGAIRSEWQLERVPMKRLAEEGQLSA